MTSQSSTGGNYPSFLSLEQQQLLYQALTSGQSKDTTPSLPTSNIPSTFSSPHQQDAYYDDLHGSSFVDQLDSSFGPDASYDFDVSHGTLPEMGNGDADSTAKSDTTDNDSPEKRPRDDDEDGIEEGGAKDPKRRESTDKVPKKPGRKPLTSEPASKRKAQNRRAQRAFRERKEKHLKDLEDKVNELEKKSEETTSEVTVLRRQLETVTAERDAYKQRMQVWDAGARPAARTRPGAPPNNYGMGVLGTGEFQFEFPRFGQLPGPPQPPALRTTGQAVSSATSPSYASPTSTSANSANGARQSSSSVSDGTQHRSSSTRLDIQSGRGGSRSSLDSGHYNMGSGSSNSPSGSSNSNMGASSSCDTSPEPFNQSPLGFKPLDTMTTIGEEQPSLFAGSMKPANNFGNIATDLSFDWLSQQNGGQFDPQLFGDYRDPQVGSLFGAAFDDSFLNDALDADFYTPYYAPPTGAAAPPKKTLIEQINEQQNALGDGGDATTIGCNEVWEKLQNCPKVQAANFDLDGLCSELKQKAKCTGHSLEVKDQEFQSVLNKYLGEDFSKKCSEQKTSGQTA